MTDGICVPYTFEEEFQRIRDLVDQCCSGVVPPDEEREPVDVRPTGRKMINGAYTEILTYNVPSDKKLQLYEFGVSLIGLSAEFRIDYSNDLLNWDLLRSYVVNVQEPSFTEQLSGPIEKLPPADAGGTHSRVRVRARMNGGACTNLQGSAFASLNGYLVPYP